MIKTLFQHLFNSLKINDKGFSLRKLLAVIAVIFAGFTTVRHSDPDNLFLILSAWLLFSLLCLGLITAAQLAEIRTGQVITTLSSTSSTSSTKTV